MPTTDRQFSRAAYYLVMFGAVVLAAVGIAGAAALAAAIVAPDSWPAGASVRLNGGGSIALVSQGAKIAVALAILAMVGLTALVVVPLLGLLRSAAAGAPFVAASVTRLRTIAAAFGIYAAIRVLGPLAMPVETARMLSLEGPQLDLGPILMALVAVVLAQVFGEGVALREDAEGTI